MSSVFQIATLLVLAGTVSVDAAKWGYTDPDHWDGTCLVGRVQSPIDLDSSKTISSYHDKLAFINYDELIPMQIVNNGHTVQYNIDYPKSTVLASGGLPGVYYFAQMHFHWGSEHTVQGQRLPLELHLVHYERSYADLSEAKTQPDGIAVVGILFKEVPENNTKLDPLIATLEKVNGVVDTEFAERLVPSALFPVDIHRFYRYRGSLTTPTCDESVVWTVLGHYVPISKAQYKRFHSLRVTNGPMGNNFRPIQKWNGRPVSLTLVAGIDAGAFAVTPATSLMAGALFSVLAHYHL